MRKILLFIPGYYGSTLVEEKSSKVRWVRLSDFFFSQKGIPATVPGTSIVADPELRPDKILKHVTLFPLVYKIDSYGKTLKYLSRFAKKHGMEIETAIYDWRDDFINSLKLIDQKIKSLNLTDNDELTIVAHSTGALLASYYLRYGAQDVEHAKENWEGAKLVKKAALIAAPFHGLMVLLRDTEAGTVQGWNKNLMSARDYSSFKSSYMFLPPAGEDVALKAEDKTLTILNLHEIETWAKNKWGIFKFLKAEEVEAGKIFIQTYMDRSQKFHNLLRAPIQNEPPKKLPLFYSWGKGHKTVQLGLISPESDRMKIDFTAHESFVDGDGTVTLESGRPLEYFKAFELDARLVECSHLDILAKHENQKVIQEFLAKN